MSPDRLWVPESSKFQVRKVLVAGSRGPCGGVVAAIDGVRLLASEGIPIKTNNDLVHNIPMVEELKADDIVSAGKDWKSLAKDTRLAWSAHGHTEEDDRIAEELGLETYDFTCSLVIRVELGVAKADRNNHYVVYIGKDGHPETRAVMSRARQENRVLVQNIEELDHLALPNDRPSEVFSQTTLMADKVAEIEQSFMMRWPDVIIHKKKDLCDATLNRQEAVKALAPQVDMLLVVGSPHSDNSNALRDVGERAGVVHSYIFDYPHQIQDAWFTPEVNVVGLTSGASVLDRFMLPVVDWLKERNPEIEVFFQEPVRDEFVGAFKLPPRTETKLKQLRGE